MDIELLLPKPRLVVPKMPSYVKLDMAFGVGAGTTLFDKSRYRSHGDIVGASWATGLHGKALDFDPTLPCYVEIPAAHTQLNFTSEDFSIVARVRVDSFAGDILLFIRGSFNSDGYYVGLVNPGIIQILTSQSGAYQYSQTASNTLLTSTWYTVGISRAGSSIIPFRNGVDVHSLEGVHINPASSSRTAKVGINDNKTSNPFDGKIEFLRIFGGIALSASAHLAWHNFLA